MVGYVPTHFVTNWLYKHVSELSAKVAGISVGIVVTIICILLSPFFGILVGVGAVCGVYTGLPNTYAFVTKRAKQNKALLEYAAQRDGMWQENVIQQRINDVFMSFQRDWSEFNLDSMRQYMSPKFYRHMELMMTALWQMGRQNLVNGPMLLESSVIGAIDDRNNDKDQFTAYINGIANDVLVRREDKWPLYTDNSSFEEFWKFDRQPDPSGVGRDTWVLDGIGQATEETYLAVAPLQQFADMGRLLLPDQGQLFSKSRFGSSDINNHVIGMWGDLLVQMYTYIPLKNRDRADNYLIGQITLPKSYGGIIVKRKQNATRNIFGGLLNWSSTPSGYQKISMEWPDFNDRYTVYATDMDKVTSFELLNPAYMVKLYDQNLPISIEVVGNIVYFYALVVSTDSQYQEMLDILQGAFRELKM
jgi:hypothetical protein